MNNNKKKQIVAKLAGVTMLTTTALGTVAPMAGVIPGVISMAEGVQVESLTGSIEATSQTVAGEDGILETKTNTTNLNIDKYVANLKLNGSPKNGDKVLISSNFSLVSENGLDIKIGDTVVGRLAYKNIDWSTEEKLDNTYYYELTFNKAIENYQNPTFSISGFNMNGNVSKFYKEGGNVINYYIKAGDKKIEKKIRLKGQNKINTAQINSKWVENWRIANSDGNKLTGLSFPFVFSQKVGANEPLKAGDKITVEIGEDSPISVTLVNGLEINKPILVNADTKDRFNSQYSVNPKTGFIKDYPNQPKIKFTEVSPKKFVFELLDTPNEGQTLHLDNFLKTTILDQSAKSVDFEKKQLKNINIKTTISRGNQKLKEVNQSDYADIQGQGISADAQKIKRGSVIVNFVDEAGKQIKKFDAPVTLEPEGTNYKIDPATYKIEGYTYKGLYKGSAPLTGKVKEGQTSITLEYKAIPKVKEEDDVEITTRWVDEAGKSLKSEVKGDKPQEPGKVDGYTFVKTEIDKDGNTVHIYHKIVTKFINIKDGKEIILKTVDGDHPKEDINGYTFVETKKDPKTGDVNHFYKDNDPAPIETITIFKDENGNVIKTEKGKKDPDKIPGYTFIKTEVDKDGNTVHIYHKIVTKFVTTKDGKDFVLKTKDGDQPKEDIDGYDYEKTEKDEKTGDVTHRYKVKAKVADKKEAVKTGASAGQFILPLVGLGGLGGLVTFAAKRKAKKKG